MLKIKLKRYPLAINKVLERKIKNFPLENDNFIQKNRVLLRK